MLESLRSTPAISKLKFACEKRSSNLVVATESYCTIAHRRDQGKGMIEVSSGVMSLGRTKHRLETVG
jgi:hypothetical protein